MSFDCLFLVLCTVFSVLRATDGKKSSSLKSMQDMASRSLKCVRQKPGSILSYITINVSIDK